MPDSAKARHILIPFVGAQSADASVVKTDEAAKKTADSLLAVVKRNPSKFEDLAKEFSSDKGSADKGGFYDWFPYNRMVTEFRDFVFENDKGKVGVVKTNFGYHVIKVEGHKNSQNVLKINTVSRQILPSETTEANIYKNVEVFASDLSKSNSIDDLAKASKYEVKQATRLTAMTETIPGLKNQRQIVTWAFNNDRSIGDTNRFELDNGGFVVVELTGITNKGLMPTENAVAQVRPILVKEKKATMIAEKMKGATLEEVAKANNTNVRTASNVSLASPTLSGVGSEPAIVGAMYGAKEGQIVNNIVGNKGVFMIQVSSKEAPTALPNYEASRNAMTTIAKTRANNLFNALKSAAKVEDNRANLY